MNEATRDWLKKALKAEKDNAREAEFDLNSANMHVEMATKKLDKARGNIEAIEADLIKS